MAKYSGVPPLCSSLQPNVCASFAAMAIRWNQTEQGENWGSILAHVSRNETRRVTRRHALYSCFIEEVSRRGGNTYLKLEFFWRLFKIILRLRTRKLWKSKSSSRIWHSFWVLWALRVCPREDRAGVTRATPPISFKLSQFMRVN